MTTYLLRNHRPSHDRLAATYSMVHVMSEVNSNWQDPVQLCAVSPQYDEGFRDGVSESKRLNAEELDAQRLRADTAEASVSSLKEEIAQEIRLSGNRLKGWSDCAVKLAAAEQRIAELSANNQQLRKLLEQTLAALNPSAKLSKSIRAALKPNPEEESHQAAREALKMENQRITPARFKCLACGDYHEGSGNLPCPKMTPYAEGQSQRTIDAIKDAGFLGSKS